MAIYKGSNKVSYVYYRGSEYTSIYLGGLAIFIPTYGITCNLENVTSNAPSSVNSGSPLSVVLTGVDGNKVQENSVIVTMGGNDITSTAYNHATKTVSIAEVTGNVSITAVGRPYDAEVEYLESDGNGYINTEVVWDDTVQFSLELNKKTSQDIGVFIGYRFVNLQTTQGNMRFFFLYGDGRIAARFGVKSINSTLKASSDAFHSISFDGNNIKVDGTQYLSVSNSDKYSTSNYGTIFLLYANVIGYYSADLKKFNGKIKSGTITKANNIVRDFIPVRDNGVGYLYDKVSGQLFGNANSSGEFTYGNDV